MSDVLGRLEQQLRRIKVAGREINLFGTPPVFAEVQPVEEKYECGMCRQIVPLIDGYLCNKCYQLYENGE